MIEHAIHSILANDSGVIGFVGDSIFYLRAQQDVETPYICLFKVSSPRVYSHGGESGLAITRIQIDIFADTYYEAKQISQVVQDVLSAYSSMSEGIRIDSCFLVNETDIYESGEEICHTALDFEIIHNE